MATTTKKVMFTENQVRAMLNVNAASLPMEAREKMIQHLKLMVKHGVNL